MDRFMKDYDFVEGTEFKGLMPKLMELVPTTGINDDQPIISEIDPKVVGGHDGHDPLEVVDWAAIMEDEKGSSSESSEE